MLTYRNSTAQPLTMNFFCFHRDISMNNITELPTNVFRNLPYLEELWGWYLFFSSFTIFLLLCFLLLMPDTVFKHCHGKKKMNGTPLWWFEMIFAQPLFLSMALFSDILHIFRFWNVNRTAETTLKLNTHCVHQISAGFGVRLLDYVSSIVFISFDSHHIVSLTIYIN